MSKLWTSVWLGLALGMSAPATGQYVTDAESFIGAVKDRDGDKVTQILDQRPTIVNSRNGRGESALVVAVNRRDDTWTRFLLSRGAQVDVAGLNGETPLIAAARVGAPELVELLLSLGAEVDKTNRMGETALIVAVQKRQYDIVEQLLEKGADPDITDSAAGYSARDYARRDNRSRKMLEMIEAADRPAAKPKQKTTDIDSFSLSN